MRFLDRRVALAPLWVFISVTGCSGEDGEGDTEAGLEGPAAAPAAAGQVTALWEAYCIATFTMDHPVIDEFDEMLFTATAGSRYLMTNFEEFFGEDHAELAYLTADGPYTFSIDVPLGTQSFPFTSNCAFGQTKPYYAVFTDVSLFAEETLATPLCEFTAGTVVESDGTKPAGFAASGFGFSGPTTYQVFLNSLDTQCGNAENGYVSVPETQVLGRTTWLVPVIQIVGPAPAP
jgi:hypothetical protein